MNIEELFHRIKEIKIKKKDVLRQESELMKKLKTCHDQGDLEFYGDGEEGRYRIDGVIINKGVSHRWEYSEAVKELQEKEIKEQIATQKEVIRWTTHFDTK